MTVCNQNRLNCGLVQSFLESHQQKDEKGQEDKKLEDYLKRLIKYNGCSQLSTDTDDTGSQDTKGKKCIHKFFLNVIRLNLILKTFSQEDLMVMINILMH